MPHSTARLARAAIVATVRTNDRLSSCPHFELSLPCDVAGLRYSNVEDMTGPMGELYLHFTATDECLKQILDSFGAVPAQPAAMAPTDGAFPFTAASVPKTFGWSFDGESYLVFRRAGNPVTGDAVALRENGHLLVYLRARYGY